MKKISITAILVLLVNLTFGQGLPTVPDQIEYTDVKVILNYDAKQKVEAEVKKLLLPDNSFLNNKIERIKLYLPIVERILEEEQVPDDLKYVAILESDLKSHLVSTSNAVGFWQMKRETGQELNLQISSIVDERENIASSTRAAAIYFKKNNQILKNWVSSTLAYNLGVSGASQVIPENWKNAKTVTFDKNTNQYLIQVIATRIAFEYKINRTPDIDLVLIEYPTSGKSLNDISQGLKVDNVLITQYNTWLKARNIPSDKEYMVVFPVRLEDEEKIYQLIDQMPKTVVVATTTTSTTRPTQNQKPSEPAVGPVKKGAFPELTALGRLDPDPRNPSFYTINGKKGILAKDGMTSSTLASVAKIRVYKFLKLNDITDKDLLIPNQVYYLQSKNNKAKVPLHTTQAGESLWQISQDYGVKLRKLLKYNRMDNVIRLQEGQIVYLQKKRPKGEPIQIATPVKEKPRTSDPVQPQNETVEVIYEAKPNPSQPETTVIYAEKTEPATPKETTVIYAESTPSSTSSNAAQHRVKAGENLYSIARIYNVSVDDIKNWNQLGGNDIIVNQILIVRGPSTKTTAPPSIDDDSEYGEKVRVVETVSKEYSNETPSKNNRQHTVKAGETMYSISKKYNTTVEEIQRLNNKTDYVLTVGSKIWVAEPTEVIGVKSTREIDQTQYHKVKPGETLYSISRTYNTSVDAIKRLNGLNSNTISIGQNLIVSEGSIKVVSKSNDVIYTVERGDTLYSISRKFSTTVQDILDWNNLSSNLISVGQKLLIKK